MLKHNVMSAVIKRNRGKRVLFQVVFVCLFNQLKHPRTHRPSYWIDEYKEIR